MIEKTKCRNCRQVYELIWDDVSVDDWKHDYDYDTDAEEEDPDEQDPVYCPFCGSHCDYSE
jgi:hypothetical protein